MTTTGTPGNDASDAHAPGAADGPLADPVLGDHDRMITATWNVGAVDADGWQPQARLSVHYIKGHGYSALLSSHREKVESGLRTEDFNFDSPRLRILDITEASRFHKGRFANQYERALAEVRRRFAAGDPKVTAIFDPAPSGAKL